MIKPPLNKPSLETAPSGHLSGVDKSTLRFEQMALIALQSIDDLGPMKLRRLLANITSISALIKGDIGLPEIGFLGQKAGLSLLSFLRNPTLSMRWEVAEKSLDWLDSKGGCVLTIDKAGYPEALKNIEGSPALLYTLGDINALNKDVISIVGARKPSPSGYRFAIQLAKDLAEAGFTVCSGMALGIDTAAHTGALQSTGATVAVWATGLDQIYPARNATLAQQIIERGAVITEMPLGTPSVPGLFPRRNRIVSSLSEGVIVVEAKRRSGSLITANYAAEQNKEVFAVPGPIERETSQGCHQLIKQGATLIESADDVIAALMGIRSLPIEQVPQILQPQKQRKTALERQLKFLEPALKQIYQQLSSEPQPLELIANRSQMPIDILNMALVDLELMGLIMVDAGLYSRK